MNKHPKFFSLSVFVLFFAGLVVINTRSTPEKSEAHKLINSAAPALRSNDSRFPASTEDTVSKVPSSGSSFGSVLKPVKKSPSVSEISQKTKLGVVNGREIQLDIASFENLMPGRSVQIEFDLFNGKKIQVESQLAASSLAGGVFIQGRIKGDPVGSVSLTHLNGILVGHIRTGSSSYQIVKSTSGPNHHFLVELDPSKTIRDIDNCVVKSYSSKSQHKRRLDFSMIQKHSLAPDGAGTVAAASSRVRIYLVYDQSAISAAGGEAAVRAELSNHISVTNTSFANSRVDVQLEIAGMERSSYRAIAEPNYATHLRRLSQGESPFSGLEETLINNNADLAMLYIHPSSNRTGGIAYLGSSDTTPENGFAVVSRDGDIGFNSPHEIGHSFGAQHDEINAGQYPPAYARGYINHSQKFGTIMSYRPTVEYETIPYFSNPAISYNGITIGSSQSGDNARRINELRDHVATYSDMRKNGGQPSDPELPEHELPFVNLPSGTQFVLSCPRPTISDPTFQWYFEGRPIPGATKSTYHFENVQPNQRGAYFCFITNGRESMNNGPTAVAVDGAVGPVIQKNLGNINPLDWRTPLALNVGVYAKPDPTFQWMRWSENGWVAIAGQTQSTLNFANIDWKDQGRYAVRVQNSLGFKMSSYVTIELKPVTRGGLVVDLDSAGAQRVYPLIRTGGFEEVENRGPARSGQ